MWNSFTHFIILTPSPSCSPPPLPSSFFPSSYLFLPLPLLPLLPFQLDNVRENSLRILIIMLFAAFVVLIGLALATQQSIRIRLRYIALPRLSLRRILSWIPSSSAVPTVELPPPKPKHPRNTVFTPSSHQLSSYE